MSLDERREMEELDGLAAALTEAGQIARAACARRQTPDPTFVSRLRAELLGDLPRVGLAPLAFAPLAAAPMPSDRPLGAPEKLADRRGLQRLAADGRRDWAGESRPELLSAAVSATRDDRPAPAPEGGKRWRARQVQTISAGRPGVPPAAAPAGLDAERAGHVAALHPSVRWRMPTRIMPPRWVAAGLAATIAIGSFLYGSTLLFPVRPDATAEVAVASTLVRGGVSGPLAQGAELHEGDEVKVGAGGQATLAMSGSFMRMAPGSDVRLESLDSNHIVVDQLAGRAYHRVAAHGSGDYRVVTASVSWVANGTAFDLDRHSTGAGGEEARGMALLDGLNLQGPQLQASLNQGQSAVVQLAGGGSPQGKPVIGQISAQALADSWLVQNAHLDALAGLDLGELAVDVNPTALPSRTPAPAATSRSVTPVATPTRQPTARPTRKPTPRPTPTGPAYLGKLTIKDNGDGTYTFTWPKYKGAEFSYYKLVYGDAGTTPTYPTASYWACNSDRDENSWTGTIDIGDYAVRLQTIDESSEVVIRAQTDVKHLKVTGPPPTAPPVQNLGPLGVSNDGGGKYTFSWAAYAGGFEFDAYKLVYVAWNGSPSYLNGDPFWAFGTGATSSGSIAVPSGDWSIRVQAIGSFDGHTFVFGQSGIYHLTVPSS
ncbi:MAG: hypothetical protein ABSD62_13455 [Candidatus Limnocylindrales bacterium]|jgi:hypothetical protein